jgi:endo-1,4-beta-xylanase
MKKKIMAVLTALSITATAVSITPMSDLTVFASSAGIQNTPGGNTSYTTDYNWFNADVSNSEDGVVFRLSPLWNVWSTYYSANHGGEGQGVFGFEITVAPVAGVADSGTISLQARTREGSAPPVNVGPGTGTDTGQFSTTAGGSLTFSWYSDTNFLTSENMVFEIRAIGTSSSQAVGFYITSVTFLGSQGQRLSSSPLYAFDPPTGNNQGNEKTVRQTIINNSQNTRFAQRINGWDVEAWTDERAAGNTTMTLFTDGSFRGEWDTTYNTLFRTGRKFAGGGAVEPRISDLDNISLRYTATQFTSTRGATYLCVYGWTRAPMVEWYVVDNWRNWNPAQAQRHTSSEVQTGFTGGTSSSSTYRWHGTMEANGGVYDIISAWRINQPSLTGNATFLQFFNIRRDTRMSGQIDISAHFDSWVALGEITNPIGTQVSSFSNDSTLYEVSFCIEGYGGDERSSGSGIVDELCIRIGTADTLCTSLGCVNCTTSSTKKPGFIVNNGTGERVTIGDALELLKFLAGIKGNALEGGNTSQSWQNALIIQGSINNNRPGIGDVLEILKHLAGIKPNGIDNPL